MLSWVMVMVGALLAANYSLPLLTVVSNRELWDEPIAVFAGNLSFACMGMGILSMLAGIRIDSLCRLVHSINVGLFMASKTAHVCLAMDQFVAVTRPLHYYQTMERAQPWGVAAIWLAFAANCIVCILTMALDLDTYAEATIGDNNASLVNDGCRWETGLTYVAAFAAELQVLVLCLATACLFIYTGVLGHRAAVSLTQGQHGRVVRPEDQRFFNNYRAFKKVLIVLSLTVMLDIFGPIVRVAGWWYTNSELTAFFNTTRLFGIILEGWAYGLTNAKLRSAYKRMLCGRSGRVICQEAAETTRCGQRQIFSIVCGKSHQDGRGETAQESPIGQPELPSLPGGETGGEGGLEMVQMEAAPVSEPHIESSVGADGNQGNQNEQEECQCEKHEASIVIDDSSDEEDSQTTQQDQIHKKRKTKTSVIVIIPQKEELV